MRVYVNNFNRLIYTRNLVEQLAAFPGIEPVIVDNNSTYPPLLGYYEICPYRVVRLKENLGRYAPWLSGLIQADGDRFYAVTDPDLDLSGIPPDLFDVLLIGLNRFPWATKAGVSLRIDDLPDNFMTYTVRAWEARFWTLPRGKWYIAEIDTTLAVYDSRRTFNFDTPFSFLNAVRAVPPYCARHLPWYLDQEYLTEEDRYYINSAKTYAYWTELLRGEKQT